MAQPPKTRFMLAVGSAVGGAALIAACGGGGSGASLGIGGKSSTTAGAPASSSTSPSTGTGGSPTSSGAATVPSVTTPPATSAPSTTAAAPTGGGTTAGNANATYPYGYTVSGGTKLALAPPNASYVNAARVKAAPAVGPFRIDPNAGPAGWPDACTMSSLAQLKALDPQITGLAGAPVGTKAQEIGGSGGNTPHNTDCKFNVTTTFTPASDVSDGTPSWVQVSLTEVDTDAPSIFQTDYQEQKKLSAQYPDQWGDYPNLPGSTHCFYDGNELQCLTGDVYYYVLGEKVTGDDTPDSSNKARWMTEVLLPLTEKLGTELQS